MSEGKFDIFGEIPEPTVDSIEHEIIKANGSQAVMDRYIEENPDLMTQVAENLADINAEASLYIARKLGDAFQAGAALRRLPDQDQ